MVFRCCATKSGSGTVTSRPNPLHWALTLLLIVPGSPLPRPSPLERTTETPSSVASDDAAADLVDLLPHVRYILDDLTIIDDADTPTRPPHPSRPDRCATSKSGFKRHRRHSAVAHVAR